MRCTRCRRPLTGREHTARGLCVRCYERERAARRKLDQLGQPEPPDEIAVYRATHGDPVYLRPVERRAAVWLLTRHGHSSKDIAERLRVSTRTVVRHRARAAEIERSCQTVVSC